MKIIINQPRVSYFVGGAEMISLDHAVNLLKLEHEVYIFTINPRSVGMDYSIQFKKFLKEYNNKINIIEIEQDNKIKYIYSIKPGEDRCRWNVESMFYNQRVYEYLVSENKKYDLIFSYYNLDAVFVPKNLINKNVLYLCGIPREQNDFQGSFLFAYDNILAISEEVKDSWKKYSNYDIKVVSTGVNFERFNLKENKDYGSNQITLLFVGRLILRKNVDKVIYAYEKLKSKYDLKLIIVGDGPERERLESISSDCIFTGVVEDTEKYYKSSDIFLTPSQYGEGLQGTILEAMSSGLTIIATNTKINKELLSSGRGYLVEPTLKSIKNGLEMAILADRNKIARRNRKYIVNNFNWVNKVKEILEAIK